MLDLYVIGCGGIGGYLIDMLPMAISSLSLDLIDKRGFSIQKYLDNAGNCSIPCVVDELRLIDGDVFNPRNALRQGCGAGSKLVQRMTAINNSMIRKTYLQNMKLTGVNEYINPTNMEEIIPLYNEVNKNNKDAHKVFAEDNYSDIAYDTCKVIFLCVDNMKTRYEVSKYAELCSDVLVINGGNEKTTGHVTLYERQGNRALDPNLYEIYPNVSPEIDKRPDELACTYIAPKHDQIAVTNSIIANIMLACFNKWARKGGLNEVDKKGRGKRKNEILIDTDNFTMTSVYHPLDNADTKQ